MGVDPIYDSFSPVVFLASGLTKGDWLEAFLFALSVAVGITPELLPMVVNACLAKRQSFDGKETDNRKKYQCDAEFWKHGCPVCG